MSVSTSQETCSFRVQIKQDLPLVELCVNGSAQPKILYDAYSSAIDLAREHKLNAIIVDSSNLTVGLDAMDLYELVEQVVGIIGELAVARVINPNQFGFYLVEQHLQNHAVNVKNFECYEEALQWALFHAREQIASKQNPSLT